MNKVLNVYWDQTLVGHYEQENGKNFFSYANSYLEQDNSKAISISMPLQAGRFDAKTTHNFFAGILPEEQQRKLIARNLGVTAGNDYALLEKIGMECAGALCILPSDESPNNYIAKYKKLTAKNIAEIIEQLPTRPLLIDGQDIRMSLAGVQDKFAIAIHDNDLFLPLNGAATTHIIKPEIPGYDFNTVLNEAFCLKLAKAIQLPAADCKVCIANKTHYLLVQRYDRELTSFNPLTIKRLQQEDFCQALNIAPENKYQNEGGPGFEQCFSLVRGVVTNKVQDMTSLLDAVIYNYIVANCDAHGKNFSLLYINNTIKLAPLYDILCTGIYPELSKKMAMKIGDEYNIDSITKSSFINFAQLIDFNKILVIDRVTSMAKKILEKIETINLDDLEIDKVKNYIGERAAKIINI